jgi:AcrR family transcriptional regulator
MSSNKSRPDARRVPLEPQRRPGHSRVAALLEAGAVVIAEKGFQAATMAEIAARAGAPIGSLYRFFPNKEILADALILRFGKRIDEAFDGIKGRVGTWSIDALTKALLSLMIDLHGERLAIRALLEAHSDWSVKRREFRRAVLRRIVQTLRLRCPALKAATAENVAVVVLHNMKTASALHAKLEGRALSGALSELHEMTCLYLAKRLGHRNS